MLGCTDPVFGNGQRCRNQGRINAAICMADRRIGIFTKAQSVDCHGVVKVIITDEAGTGIKPKEMIGYKTDGAYVIRSRDSRA